MVRFEEDSFTTLNSVFTFSVLAFEGSVVGIFVGGQGACLRLQSIQQITSLKVKKHQENGLFLASFGCGEDFLP